MIDLNTIDTLTVDELRDQETRLERALYAIRGARHGLEDLQRVQAARAEVERESENLESLKRLVAAPPRETAEPPAERTKAADDYQRALEIAADIIRTGEVQVGDDPIPDVEAIARQIVAEAHRTDQTVEDAYAAVAYLQGDRSDATVAAFAAGGWIEAARQPPEPKPETPQTGGQHPEQFISDDGLESDLERAMAPAAPDTIDEPPASAESSPTSTPAAAPRNRGVTHASQGASPTRDRILAVFQANPDEWIGSGKAGQRAEPPVADGHIRAVKCRELASEGLIEHNGKGGARSAYRLVADRELSLDEPTGARILTADEAADRIREQDAETAPAPADVDDQPTGRRLNLKPKDEPERPPGPPKLLTRADPDADAEAALGVKRNGTMNGRILSSITYRECTFPELVTRLGVIDAEERNEALRELDKLIKEGEIERKREHPGQVWTYYARHPALV